jgi:hypothetical protein
VTIEANPWLFLTFLICSDLMWFSDRRRWENRNDIWLAPESLSHLITSGRENRFSEAQFTRRRIPGAGSNAWQSSDLPSIRPDARSLIFHRD